ncbi:MAG: YihY/virulence factor BrkB family protein [Dysgonamonadaceae bacterium]|jgi:membrane protein|nr:YihY/virulence factor BrkB family protein [Dysgonamonadaceae bacterium]
MEENRDKNTEQGKKGKEYRPSRIVQWKVRVSELVEFLSYDIWRIDSKSLSKNTNLFYNVIKTVILTGRNTHELNLGSLASSLTYSTILSIVPLLAVLFAVARGFGFENILQSEIFNYLGMNIADPSAADDGQVTFGTQVVNAINNSLEYAKGSVFTGVGVILLLYTVYALFANIEGTFNKIWQIKKGRAIERQITDYFALVIILPVMMLLNSGLSIMISSSSVYFDKFGYILEPLIPQFMKILPYIVNILVLTSLYKFMPNTKVHFLNAFIAGTVAGLAFQVFQMMYLSGFLWITKYNAIYGTFAAIPLMLLWMQLAWYIVLIGVELSFAAQNVRKFSFEKETRTISRQYRDFFTLITATEIVKRFAEKKPPLTADELSEVCKVPVGLANRIIDDLQDMHILTPTPSFSDEHITAYQPAIDINLISVNYLMKKIDQFGSSDFNVDINGKYLSEWDVLMASRASFYEKNPDVLLKDI